MKERAGEAPLLLLDDVLSELDEERGSAFLAEISGYEQAFVTATHAPFGLPAGDTAGTRARCCRICRCAVLKLSRAMKQWAPDARGDGPLALLEAAWARDRRVGHRAKLVSGADRRQDAARSHALQRLEPPAEFFGARDSPSRRRSRAGCRDRALAFPHRAATHAWPASHRRRGRNRAPLPAGCAPRGVQPRARHWSASGRPWSGKRGPSVEPGGKSAPSARRS